MARLTMEAPELERRLAAIVAADVEGYSRLMHGDEEATMSTLSARRAVIDDLIAAHRGRIANTAGDSVLAEFASVLDAVSCAVEIQKAMSQANETTATHPMRFRIGINVGDVMVKDGDIFGDGVNVAARLEALAEGGGICVSRGVHDHLQNRAKFVFADLGEQLVKNIAHPVRAYRLHIGDGTQELVTEAPLPADAEHSDDNEVALELALWESVKDGGATELDSYLEHYPEGTFASLAHTRQSAVEDEQTSSAQPTTQGELEATPDALDLAFWDAIKDSQVLEEFAAYLEQHPDGHFSALARARLSQLHDGNPSETPTRQSGTQDAAIELAFWESIRGTEDPHLMAAYLEKYPGGEFADIAKARLVTLSNEETEDRQP
jgi:adenylate cyclase